MKERKKLTQRIVRDALDYNEGTGILKWKIPAGFNTQIVGKTAGSVTEQGYSRLCINGVQIFAHRIIWLYKHGYLPENQIDHIDRNRLNNRLDNLREVTQVCNSRNSGNPKTNTSGVKGVYKKDNGWQVSVKVFQKIHYIGFSLEFSEAVCLRLAAEQCLNWSGCDSNSPAFRYVRKNIQNETKKDRDRPPVPIADMEPDFSDASTREV